MVFLCGGDGRLTVVTSYVNGCGCVVNEMVGLGSRW